MTAKKNVFSSKSERANLLKLSREWSDKYDIYHNLPFLNVFDPVGLVDLSDWRNPQPIRLTELELSRLKKTSIDYTLCDGSDKPIICIEFDGLQQGYNVGTTYQTNIQSTAWRKEITELKLKVAHGSEFPFFVVGSDYFEDISPQTKLTIVDGIIGEVIGNQVARGRMNQGFDPTEVGWTKEDFVELPENEKHDIVQDWIIGVEIDAEMEHNPVSRRLEELDGKVSSISYSIEYLVSPSIDHISDPSELIRHYDQAKFHGTRVTLTTEDFGPVKATAWLPNFKAPWHSGVRLSEEIAKLLALEKLGKLRRSQD
jgi:hypothetical protein